MRPYGARLGAWAFAANDVDVVRIATRARRRSQARRAIAEGERDADNLRGLGEEIEAVACYEGKACPTCGPRPQESKR